MPRGDDAGRQPASGAATDDHDILNGLNHGREGPKENGDVKPKPDIPASCYHQKR
jgi:hypothetical protein